VVGKLGAHGPVAAGHVANARAEGDGEGRPDVEPTNILARAGIGYDTAAESDSWDQVMPALGPGHVERESSVGHVERQREIPEVARRAEHTGRDHIALREHARRMHGELHGTA